MTGAVASGGIMCEEGVFLGCCFVYGNVGRLWRAWRGLVGRCNSTKSHHVLKASAFRCA